MLFRYLDLLLSDPAEFFILTFLVVVALVIALTVHEFSHALVANGLGDDTARRSGRLTLNPLRHLDPAGTVLFLLAGIGWAKPVPVNLYALPRGRLDMALVAVAGPISNIIITFLIAIPVRWNLVQWGLIPDLLNVAIVFNLIVAAINLLPVFPLDGAKVISGIVPGSLSPAVYRIERYGPIILILVIIVDYVTGAGLIWKTIGPMVNTLRELAVGI